MKTGLFCMAAILCWLLAVPATRSLGAATGEKELSQADNVVYSGEANAANFDISSLVAEGFTATPDLKVYPEREDPPCPWCTTFRIEL